MYKSDIDWFNDETNHEDTNLIYHVPTFFEDEDYDFTSNDVSIGNDFKFKNGDVSISNRLTDYYGNYNGNAQISNEMELRTVYFGNLPPMIKMARFLNYIRGGMIDSVKHLQERNCIFITFVESQCAALVYNQCMQKKLFIDGMEVRVGWGHPSALDEHIFSQIQLGATRNVFVSNLDPIMTSVWLQREFTRFGVVESVKVLEDRRIAFIHMSSIASAVKAVAILKEESQWASRRIFYGRDRCGELLDPVNGSHCSSCSDSEDEIRTIYIGSIKPGVTTRDICDNIRGGILQHIKYFPEKKIAFATFIDKSAAKAFYERSLLNPISIKSKRVKLGWGKSHGFPLSLSTAVANGATRNIYVGNITNNDIQELLIEELELFGEIELIKLFPEKQCGFFSYTDISCAIRAMETLSSKREFELLKFGFGKDRCGFPHRGKLGNNGALTPPSTPH